MKICYIAPKRSVETKKSMRCYSVSPAIVMPVLVILKNISKIAPNIAWSIVVVGLVVEILKAMQSKDGDELRKGLIRLSGAAVVAMMLPHLTDIIDLFVDNAFSHVTLPTVK